MDDMSLQMKEEGVADGAKWRKSTLLFLVASS